MTPGRRSFVAALGAAVLPAAAYEFPAGLRGDVAAFALRVTQAHGFPEGWAEDMLRSAQPQPAIVKAVSSPGTARPWRDFRPTYLNRQRIDGGTGFWATYADLLAAATRSFGVPEEIVVAILGVETIYGRNVGSYRVLDALYTLGFEVPARAAYFQGELEQFLLLARAGQLDPMQVKGSYAGAMGWPQFMPTSVRRFAVDFDGDGRTDLWQSPADVVASVANFLLVHGWAVGQDVAVRAWPVDPGRVAGAVARGVKPSLARADLDELGVTTERPLRDGEMASLLAFEGTEGDEYWAGLDNFYVITRYNRSQNYALAVWQLARAIAAAYGRG